ncbi:MAG: hypothetical protein PHF86_02505 [Candidatus Nanoarchaeia archaeon]|jgi:hypothetical protein|nr:hypothetical protein [Candidatus Nanoarchaeia archaeon]
MTNRKLFEICSEKLKDISDEDLLLQHDIKQIKLIQEGNNPPLLIISKKYKYQIKIYGEEDIIKKIEEIKNLYNGIKTS